MTKFQREKLKQDFNSAEQKAKEILQEGEDEADSLLIKTAQSNGTIWMLLGAVAAVGVIGALLVWA